MNFFTILSVASSISSGFLNIQQAQATKAYYDAQADLTRLQYAQKKLAVKQEAQKVLRATNSAIATAVARAASGGILSTEGSALFSQAVSLRGAAEDLQTTEFNQRILDNFATIESTSLKTAGDYTQRFGYLTAITGLGTDLSQAYKETATPKPATIPRRFGNFTADDLNLMDRAE